MKLLTATKPGRKSPTGTEHFLSTYRRSDFRLSKSLMREFDDPTDLCIETARTRAYLAPCPQGAKVTYDGKFSSRQLRDWLGDPEPGTHYAVTLIQDKIGRLTKKEPRSE